MHVHILAIYENVAYCGGQLLWGFESSIEKNVLIIVAELHRVETEKFPEVTGNVQEPSR